MERGYGDESPTVNDRLIPRRAVRSQVGDEIYPESLQRGPQPYQPDGMESTYPRRPVSLSWQPPETGNSSEATLRPYAYQQYAPNPPGKSELRYSLQADPSAVKGYVIQPNWKRHFLAWILAFFAICFFVFTIVFAWNATGGSNADTRLLFNNPGHTILVLQVCSTVTTAMFAELIVASCEMLRWALTTRGTKLTTFIGLSRATGLYGQVYLFLSKFTHPYTKFLIFQRLLLHIFVLVASVILLSSVTIPMSFPVLVPVANGSVGLGEFGTSDPTFALPAFKFTGFLDDSTKVVGVEPACQGNGCFSFFLPGGIDSVNQSCQVSFQGAPNVEEICSMLAATGSGGDMGILQGVLNDGVIPASNLPPNSPPSLLDVNLTEILNGGDSFFSKEHGQRKRQLNDLFPTSGNSPPSPSPSPDSGPGSLNASGVPPGVNLGALLTDVSGNYFNWTAYRENATANYHTTDLAYVTYDSKGYLLDFSPLTGDWPEFNNICSTWDASYMFNITLTVCVASETDGLNQSTIVAGIRNCDTFGMFGPNCANATTEMLYTTRMHIQKANGTTAYALGNGTILSFGDLSDPVDYPVNITLFFNSLIAPLLQTKLVQWLQLGSPNASLDITPLLIISLLSDFAYDNSVPWDGTTQLRNMMASAISTASLLQDIVANASPQALTKIVYTLRLAPVTLYTFIILGCLVFLWCLPVMFWSSRFLTANTSGFPEVDFASKGVLAQTMEGLSNAESRGVVKKLGGDLDVFMGEAVREVSETRMIVLDTAPAEKLSRDVVYS